MRFLWFCSWRRYDQYGSLNEEGFTKGYNYRVAYFFFIQDITLEVILIYIQWSWISTRHKIKIKSKIYTVILFGHFFYLFKIIIQIVDMTFNVGNTEGLEAHLANNPYFSEGGLPGAEDARILFDLKDAPDVNKTPNLYYWYQFVNSFSNDLMKKWIEKADANKPKVEEAKKVETKEVKKDEGDDLFDDDDAPKVAKVEAPKPAPKQKKAVIAKSIVVFDVKIFDEDTDLDALASKVLEIKLDGLVWNNEPKKLPVAYNIKKLQFGCVIEDDKVMTDDIFQKIQAWEDIVQSVDMVSMQKV